MPLMFIEVTPVDGGEELVAIRHIERIAIPNRHSNSRAKCLISISSTNTILQVTNDYTAIKFLLKIVQDDE